VTGAGTTDATRQVEVAALTAANLNYNNIDLVLVDGNANRIDQRNLAACTITRNQGANPTLDFIVCANWQANLAVSGTARAPAVATTEHLHVGRGSGGADNADGSAEYR
jgi:hypothetical protein